MLLGARKALLVGISDYENVPPINNPVNDVDLLTKSLTAADFEIKALKNLGIESLRKEIDGFFSSLKADDVAFFYFAGHGMQSGGVNLLLARDVDPDSQGFTGSLPLSEVLEIAKKNPARLNVLLLDCCRNWPEEVGTAGLAQVIDAPNRTYVSFSTSANQVASDGVGKNSPYAEALATALEARPDEGLSVIDTLQNASQLVALRTNKEQNPVLYLDASLEPFYLFEPTTSKKPTPHDDKKSSTGSDAFPEVELKDSWITASARNIDWQSFEKCPPLKLNSLTIQPVSISKSNEGYRFNCTMVSSEAIDFHLNKPWAYDRNGQIYLQSYLLDSRDRKTNSLRYTLVPGEKTDLAFTFEQIPDDLDGFTTLLFKLSLNGERLSIPMEKILINRNASTPSLPLSRVQESQQVEAGVTRLQKTGTDVSVTIALTSPEDQTLRIDHYAAYDEIGRLYLKGGYRLDKTAKAENQGRFDVFLPAGQPVAITLEIENIPEECAGLTYLRLFGKVGEQNHDFEFRELPLLASRSKPEEDPIPRLVWRLPQTRETLVEQNIEFGLRETNTVGSNCTVNLMLVSEHPQMIEINSCRAYLSDGTLLDASSSGLLGSIYGTNSRRIFRLPGIQPLRYSVSLANLPPNASEISLLRVEALVDGKKAVFDVPSVPLLSEKAGATSDPSTTKSHVEPLAIEQSDDLALELLEINPEPTQTQIILRLVNRGAEREISLQLDDDEVTLKNDTKNLYLPTRGAAIKVFGQLQGHNRISITLPKEQSVRLSLIFPQGSTEIWKSLSYLRLPYQILETDPNGRYRSSLVKDTSFRFRDVVLPAPVADQGGSALDRLRR